jgi:hypothetical protein
MKAQAQDLHWPTEINAATPTDLEQLFYLAMRWLGESRFKKVKF